MCGYGHEDELICSDPVEKGKMFDIHVAGSARWSTCVCHGDCSGVVFIEWRGIALFNAEVVKDGT